jgi:hypothetical protein
MEGRLRLFSGTAGFRPGVYAGLKGPFSIDFPCFHGVSRVYAAPFRHAEPDKSGRQNDYEIWFAACLTRREPPGLQRLRRKAR